MLLVFVESHTILRDVSSGEAEYLLLVTGAQEGLFIQHLASELGLQLRLCLGSDASAAISMSQRAGAGKTRHMALRVMFLKDLVRHGVLVLEKIRSAENPADCLTKAVSGEELEKCLRISGCWPTEFGFEEVVQMIHVDTPVAHALLGQV